MLGGVTRVLEMKHVSSHIRVPGAGLGGAEVTSFTYCPRVSTDYCYVARRVVFAHADASLTPYFIVYT